MYILTSKCASRHNGVQLFISHLASWLRTRRFSEPTFRPSGAPNHWKNIVFWDFPTFSRNCIFFLLALSLLSASSLLCFSSVHIVGSLTSKLPSIIYVSIYLHVYTCPHLLTFFHICLPCLHLDIQYMHKNAGCMLRLLLLPGSCCAPSISKTRPCFLFKTCRPRFSM